MASLNGSITLYPAGALANLGFNAANVNIWVHDAVNNRPILLEERVINLANPVNIPFGLQQSNTPSAYLHLAIQFATESTMGRSLVGSTRVPLQELVWPRLFMQVISEIHNSTGQYSLAAVDVNVTSELPVYYPGPFPFPPAMYPNAGYMALPPRPQYLENPILVNAVTHSLGGIFGQVASEGINQMGFGDALGDFLNQIGFGDALANFFN